MAVTTIGRQIVRGVLPQKYKNYADRELNKGTIQKLTTAMAKQDPDAYINILQDLNKIGQRVVSVYGKDTTITLDDLDTGAQVRNASNKLKQLISNVVNSDDLTQQQKQQKIIDLGYKYTEKLRQVAVDDAQKRKTGIANQIKSGSRGNAVQLMQLVIGDMMMKDAANRDIPYLAMASYADGDSPMSYWASAMSGRKSTYDVQAATGKVGYLGKQATNITHNTPIAVYDCGTKNTGVPVKAQSTDNVGALLLRPWHNHPAGAVVTQKMVAQAGPDDQMVIRSPITCKAHNGVCALCSGIQQNGKLPVIGSYVAMNAAKTFIQPLTQSGISCLHGDTLVRMADWSVKKIRDIEVGDMVIGSDQQGNCRPVKVNYVFNNGIQPVWKSTLSVGTSKIKTIQIMSTLEHKFMVTTDAKKKPVLAKLGNIQQSKKYLGLPKVIDIVGGTHHEPMAFILGLLCGDGCYTAGVKNQVHLSCADDSLIDYLHGYLEPFGVKISLCAGQKIYYGLSKTVRGHQKNPVRLKLQQYGMMGKYAWQKTLPNNWRQWDAQSIKEFISGLMTADGHIGIHRTNKQTTGGYKFNLNNTSKQLLEQVAQCFQRYAGIYIKHISQSNAGHPRTLYMLQTGNPVFTKRLLQWLDFRGIKKVTASRMLQQINAEFQVFQPPLVSKVLNQQFMGDLETFDIEVDHPSHLFILANGII